MQCNTCNEIKHISRFSLRKDTKKIRNECKDCQNIRKSLWKNNNPEKFKKTLLKRYPWRAYKKSLCERCGFIPINSCQLDVDHIDSNKKNNDPSNLQTLCSNCHKLKTYFDIKSGKIKSNRISI